MGKAAALDAASAGATLSTKTANFAMSEEGKAVIQHGVKDGVAFGSAVATGNALGATVNGAKLAKDGY